MQNSDSLVSPVSESDISTIPTVACSSAIAIGSCVSASRDYELVIGGSVRDEIRVVMTPEEYAVVKALLVRASNSGN